MKADHFSDEKRFCLNGPDKRLPKLMFSKRAKGGGEVMVRGRLVGEV